VVDEIIDIKKYKGMLSAVNDELSQLPDGSLIRKGTRYYHFLKGTEIGITKNKLLIKKLCRKRYLLVFKKDLERNISIISGPSKKIIEKSHEERITNLSKAYDGLPEAYFYHPTIEPWLKKSYPTMSFKMEGRKYKMKNGTLLRSKSEYMIANTLEEYGIPYRYEIPMKMGSKTIYPDFTIKHPYTGKTIIWEHFGALHQPKYEASMNEKMKGYLAQGYIPFETIIYTFEFDIESTIRLERLAKTLLKSGS